MIREKRLEVTMCLKESEIYGGWVGGGHGESKKKKSIEIMKIMLKTKQYIYV